MRQLILVTCVIALWSSIAAAADVKVLSAGAVEPGLQRAAEQFKRASGNEIKMQFNTAPQLAKRMADGEVADILIAPPAVLDEQAKNGKISMQGRLTLGRVGAGVVVRSDAPGAETGDAQRGLNHLQHRVQRTLPGKIVRKNRYSRTDQGQDNALSHWRGCDGPHHQRQGQ
jgi:hypothetical protein